MQRLTDEILLGLQHAAYQLLFAVDGLAKRDPTWLSSAALERIKTPRTCAAWLREKRGALPPELFPPPELEEAFAALFASFLETSFVVAGTEWDGQLLAATIQRRGRSSRAHGVTAPRGESRDRGLGKGQVVALAVKHRLSREGVKLSVGDASRLARRPDVKVDAIIVAYMWELERRALGKGKGPVAHELWCSMPRPVRSSLCAEQVWLAVSRLIEAANEAAGAAEWE